MDTNTACKEDLHQHTQVSLLKYHEPLVKGIAYHLLSHLPRSILFEDLMQAGWMGLLEAAKHYDESKGASFSTYAAIRIRGFMLDEIRRNDWVPRSVYRNARTLSLATKRVEDDLGRKARDSEIAAELGLNSEEYTHFLQEANAHPCYGFEDLGLNDDFIQAPEAFSAEPQTLALKADLLKKLFKLIAKFPKKERLVLALYYQHELNLKEIGDILNVSESRISQLLTQITSRIKMLVSAKGMNS